MRWVAPAVVLLAPNVAWACPLCIAAREESRIAFIVTTGILTFLPLMMIGGVIWWIRKRYQAAERDPIEELFS